MASIYFNKDNHKELLSVPLRGVYLEEFLKLMEETLSLAKTAALLRTAEENRPFVKQINATQQAVVDRIIAGFNTPGALRVGITAEELKDFAYAATRVDSDNIDGERIHQRSRDIKERVEAGDKSFDDDILENIAENSVEALMHNFCFCLALQEHKENDFVKMNIDARHENIVAITERFVRGLPDAPPLSAKTKTDLSGGAMTSVMELLTLHDIHKRRNSMITDMESKILFGRKPSATSLEGIVGEIRNLLVVINDLDLSKKRDVEELRRIEKDALEYGAKETNLPLPSAQQLG